MRLKGTVYSQVLENDSSISIVTPNNLNSDKPYNVVYLLHGLKGDSASWLDYCGHEAGLPLLHLHHGGTAGNLP